MKALVLVHPEITYSREDKILYLQERNNGELLARIVQRANAAPERKEKVIYLGYSSISTASPHISAEIRRNLARGTFFPAIGTIESQFMLAKNRLLEDRPEEISICGVGYQEVRRFYELVTCQGNWNDERDIYELRTAEMGWKQPKWRKVYNTPLNAALLMDLTDADLLEKLQNTS